MVVQLQRVELVISSPALLKLLMRSMLHTIFRGTVRYPSACWIVEGTSDQHRSMS